MQQEIATVGWISASLIRLGGIGTRWPRRVTVPPVRSRFCRDSPHAADKIR